MRVSRKNRWQAAQKPLYYFTIGLSTLSLHVYKQQFSQKMNTLFMQRRMKNVRKGFKRTQKSADTLVSISGSESFWYFCLAGTQYSDSGHARSVYLIISNRIVSFYRVLKLLLLACSLIYTFPDYHY